eukprot:12417820-Karenia_brevis.AAC.1
MPGWTLMDYLCPPLLPLLLQSLPLPGPMGHQNRFFRRIHPQKTNDIFRVGTYVAYQSGFEFGRHSLEC